MGTNPMIKCWWQGQGQAKDKMWPEAFHASTTGSRWMTTGFHWEMGAAATEWRLIDTDLIAVAKYLQNAQARLFREVCLAGAKNWIWSLAFDRSCHHRSARLLLGCWLWHFKLLKWVLLWRVSCVYQCYTLRLARLSFSFESYDTNPTFIPPLIERYNDKTLLLPKPHSLWFDRV